MKTPLSPWFRFAGLALLLCAAHTAEAQRFGSGSSRTRGSSSTTVQRAQSVVVAVADERSNAIIVSASTNSHAMIEALLTSLDANVDDITEVRVFKLENADPVEMSEILNQLFDDTSSQTNDRGSGFRSPFSFFGRGGGRGGDNEALRSSQKVTAVPDPRTASLIVSAPRMMMNQIAAMVEQLDQSNAKRQKVFVYTLEHADVNNVSEMLRSMFEGPNTRSTLQNNNQQDNVLRSRSGTFGQAGATSANGIGGAGTGGNARGGIRR